MKKKQRYLCKDAFLHNPVASAQDCTGFSPTKSYTEEEAESKSQLCNVPATGSDGGEAAPPAR
ncbi:MAG: hypothetical protein IKV74_01200 [Clostridia bacterium]|nr:hypothetical protein [Clostridia bacterium]